ncbi:MAG: glutamine--fructose-6-phosphate transaminase (isomerizing) [Candidatus Peribacteraceae bacterium]|jgi:glucosamine--fructose-6-phosphate aminotransferase (isomerizing)
MASVCGIFGYIGSRTDAGRLVVEGLKCLEYRGYDSWGVACKSKKGIKVRKDIGKVSEVKSEDFADECSMALAHTRWATHGGVTKTNAHPHLSCDKTIAVVHNGIVENYDALRNELKAKGHRFLSQTDTEVLPHLIEEELKSQKDFAAAVRAACGRLKGRYGILALHAESQTLVAARSGSPLIIGVQKDLAGQNNGYFIASDIPAFLDHTRVVQYLDDGEMVVTDGKTILFSDIRTGRERPKREIEIHWSTEQAHKGSYEHYMLKEIMEQKESVARAVNQDEEQIKTLAKAIKEAQGTFLVGCGTAGKACMAAEYFFSVIAKHHVNYAAASEFKLYHHFLKPESLLIAVSQSGETADVLEAMHIAKQAGSKVLAIVNNEGSTIAREADYSLRINAGPERAVASTKALTGQLAVFLLIAHALAGKLQEGKTLLLETAAEINDMLNPRYVERLRTLAERIKGTRDIFIIGKGWNYPMAMESAIKIQEVSYVHAEGFAGGELKHGPIALIEEGTPCIALVGNDEVKDDILNNTIELKARGASIIGISPTKHEAFDEWVKVPDAGAAQALVNIIPVQVLAYYLAVKRGKNPDMPRNLAKSVTVK